MRNVGNCARVTPRSRRSTFTFLKKGRGESHPLLFHPLPLRLADDSCESATERFTQLPQRRWNDAQVRGRKRCRYHCSNCGLYCLERNVASSNYPPVLLLEPRWVITVNGSVFVLLKDYTCVCLWVKWKKEEGIIICIVTRHFISIELSIVNYIYIYPTRLINHFDISKIIHVPFPSCFKKEKISYISKINIYSLYFYNERIPTLN